MAKFAALVLMRSRARLARGAAEPAATEPKASAPVPWETWRAGNAVADTASLQRGARNFMSYCNGCHSLKYMRYQRMADDMQIPTGALSANRSGPGSTNPYYIETSP